MSKSNENRVYVFLILFNSFQFYCCFAFECDALNVIEYTRIRTPIQYHRMDKPIYSTTTTLTEIWRISFVFGFNTIQNSFI